MGKTISEKILSLHSGQNAKAGDLVIAKIDFIMGQDGTSGIIIDSFNKMRGKKVFNPKKFAICIDHSAPSPNIGVSTIHKKLREFAKAQKTILYDVGGGICHQLLPEMGHVVPGDLVVGADSHTCTYGAINVFSTGMGSTDVAAGVISGKLWFKVPETIKVIYHGKLPKGVYSKDMILKLIGDIGADGATYQALEFYGEAIDSLSVDARFTISNMAIECGAKVGLMAADEKVLTWVKKHARPLDRSHGRGARPQDADKDAKYVKVIKIDVSKLKPLVAKPHAVDNVSPISEVAGIPIHQGFIGTCTNGRVEDLEIAASILKGKKVHQNCRLIVVPASRQIFLEATKIGIIETFIKAGAAVLAPGCGPCVGTHEGIPADGENVISTANRNFKGRMGNPNAFIYLASPATVAASVIEGKISDPRKYL